MDKARKVMIAQKLSDLIEQLPDDITVANIFHTILRKKNMKATIPSNRDNSYFMSDSDVLRTIEETSKELNQPQ